MKRFIIEVAEANLFFKHHESNLAFTVTPYRNHALIIENEFVARMQCDVLIVAYPGMSFRSIPFNPERPYEEFEG